MRRYLLPLFLLLLPTLALSAEMSTLPEWAQGRLAQNSNDRVVPPTPPPPIVSEPEAKLPPSVVLLNDANHRTDRDWCAQFFELRPITAGESRAPLKTGLMLTRGNDPRCLGEDRRVSFEVATDGKTFVPVDEAPYVRPYVDPRPSRVVPDNWRSKTKVFVLADKGQYQFRARVESGTRGALVGPVAVTVE